MRPGDPAGSASTHQDLGGPVLARCRPGAPGWFLAIVFALIGGLIVATAPGSTTDAAGRWFYWCLGAACLVPSFVLAAWLLRAQVLADNSGLRWRGLGRWRCASWEQVADYFEKPFSRGKQLVLETGAGTIKLSEEWWSDLQRLRGAVELHARSALAKTWAPLGTRPDERWPLVFSYGRADERSMAIIFWCCELAWVSLMAFFFGPPKTRGVVETLENLGWPLGLLGAVALLGFILSMPAMSLPMGLQLRDTHRRRNQRIIVDADGLLFEEAARRVAATWAEVTDYFVAPRPGRLAFGARNVVITTKGSFDFTPFLSGVLTLMRVIAQHARNAPAADWRARTDEVLGGEASRRGRDARGYGERIYHYRTRTNRALLWFPTALALMYTLVPVLMSQASLQPPRGSAGPFLAGIMGFLTIWGWWRYRSASVRTSAWGITQHTLFGRRSIPWNQMRDFYDVGGDVWRFGIVAGDRTRIWFWLGIGDVDKLKDEIAHRAVNARGSQWKRKARARRIR